MNFISSYWDLKSLFGLRSKQMEKYWGEGVIDMKRKSNPALVSIDWIVNVFVFKTHELIVYCKNDYVVCANA